MGKYNLLEEEWIPVIESESLKNIKVSLIDIFENAQSYKDLACEMKAQDFVLLRLLLAVLMTVFTRFDESGEIYEQISLDENFIPKEEVDRDDIKDYKKKLINTWSILWENKKFPPIVKTYLEKWKDHFYLFDDKYPFFQVNESDIKNNIRKKSAFTLVSGKNINRLISESDNKISLFSPKYQKNSNKEILKADELVRWLLTFQAYTGLADKAIFGDDKYEVSNSKGWPYDLGGIYFKTSNLFETLMLNLTILHPQEVYNGKIQRPCWEYASDDLIKSYLSYRDVDNLSELFTNWSRAIYIDPKIDITKSFSMKIIKLPEIRHINNFLEPMTLWRFNNNGPNKDKYTPKKHMADESLWRNFAMLISPQNSSEKIHIPGLMEWKNSWEEYKNEKKSRLIDIIGDINLRIEAISMKDDGNATSWVPIDELTDYLNINNFVLTDVNQNDWENHIIDMVNITKISVGKTYGIFIENIIKIRNIKSETYKTQKLDELYSTIDGPFKDWICSINSQDLVEKKILQWKTTLKNLVLRQADKDFEEASTRDFKGIVEGDKIINIATSYNSFKHFLKESLKI